MDNQVAPEDAEKQAPHVRADYYKAPGFRNVLCDGVFGGVRGDGMLQMIVFSQRPSVPDTTVLSLDKDGNPEETHTTDADFVREVEVCMTMNPVVARKVRDWLDESVAALMEHKKQQKEAAKKESSK